MAPPALFKSMKMEEPEPGAHEQRLVKEWGVSARPVPDRFEAHDVDELKMVKAHSTEVEKQNGELREHVDELEADAREHRQKIEELTRDNSHVRKTLEKMLYLSRDMLKTVRAARQQHVALAREARAASLNVKELRAHHVYVMNKHRTMNTRVAGLHKEKVLRKEAMLVALFKWIDERVPLRIVSKHPVPIVESSIRS